MDDAKEEQQEEEHEKEIEREIKITAAAGMIRDSDIKKGFTFCLFCDRITFDPKGAGHAAVLLEGIATTAGVKERAVGFPFCNPCYRSHKDFDAFLEAAILRLRQLGMGIDSKHYMRDAPKAEDLERWLDKAKKEQEKRG